MPYYVFIIAKVCEASVTVVFFACNVCMLYILQWCTLNWRCISICVFVLLPYLSHIFPCIQSADCMIFLVVHFLAACIVAYFPFRYLSSGEIFCHLMCLFVSTGCVCQWYSHFVRCKTILSISILNCFLCHWIRYFHIGCVVERCVRVDSSECVILDVF